MASVSVESKGYATLKAAHRGDVTPDCRYFVVRGRLWRLSNPALDPTMHDHLVRELMAARRGVRNATESTQRTAARHKINAAKKALGERGEVWWDDGAPDYNRFLAVNTPYAAWFRSLCNGPRLRKITSG